ncbi:hypothetical protein AAFF_G00090690 [Aldrovandia affinis]|uniref:Uncharacterized protein n=1 Tax=Aldrovandia affinis TaxID=143900 RepID=A0AAD7RVZ3_9TELE|nr:hypothetical protein AAFF_G00090690 [Aldrovandia affinis]
MTAQHQHRCPRNPSSSIRNSLLCLKPVRSHSQRLSHAPLQRLRVAHDFSRQAQETVGLRQKRAFDQHCKGQAFKPGDRVWIHCPVRKKGLSPKLQSHWRRPGEVVGRVSEVTIPGARAKAAAGGQEGSSPVSPTPPAAEEATPCTPGQPTRQRRLPSYLSSYEVDRLGTVGSSGTSDPLGGGCVVILPPVSIAHC